MPKGYWIASVTVNDAENYNQYIAAAKPVFERFGARALVRGGAYEAVEGTARDRNVVLEFESLEQARACYYSPEYQDAANIRQASSDSHLLIIEGAE